MYSEKNIDWSFFPEIRDKWLVQYSRPDFYQLAAKSTGLSEKEVERRWRQLMYFFSTFKILSNAGSLLPGNEPIEPPPKLALIWKSFCQIMPGNACDFCATFFNGKNLLWQETYPEQNKLNASNLSLFVQTAGPGMIGFEIDQNLWCI